MNAEISESELTDVNFSFTDLTQIESCIPIFIIYHCMSEYTEFWELSAVEKFDIDKVRNSQGGNDM